MCELLKWSMRVSTYRLYVCNEICGSSASAFADHICVVHRFHCTHKRSWYRHRMRSLVVYQLGWRSSRFGVYVPLAQTSSRVVFKSGVCLCDEFSLNKHTTQRFRLESRSLCAFLTKQYPQYGFSSDCAYNTPNNPPFTQRLTHLGVYLTVMMYVVNIFLVAVCVLAWFFISLKFASCFRNCARSRTLFIVYRVHSFRMNRKRGRDRKNCWSSLLVEWRISDCESARKKNVFFFTFSHYGFWIFKCRKPIIIEWLCSSRMFVRKPMTKFQTRCFLIFTNKQFMCAHALR